MITRTARLVAALGILISAIGIGVGVFASTSASADGSQTTTITLQGNSYTPKAPQGGTDDYHCTLVNPHLTSNYYIVGDQFFPNDPKGKQEVHHAILFYVPPAFAARAREANQGGNGWTCFGETALPGTFPTGTHISSDFGTPWLAAWAPGVPFVPEPPGTGVPFPAGSMVIMQVHYNLLEGDSPVRVKLKLKLAPASTPLKPLQLDLLAAPPDVPCPTGVTGPLCNRQAALANLAQRTGADQVAFVNGLEAVCGRNPADPPVGDTTSCTWPMEPGREILRVAAHMHLRGVGLELTLNPGTPTQRVVLNVTDYDFNNQSPYNLKTPVITGPGDTMQVKCTYNPQLAEELPQLRKLPPKFVTWGDGSSDEMCLGLVLSIKAPAGAQPSTSTAPVQSTQI
jgi:Copper type II ascorbate-dependent monooxygenase, C-terminal domain